VTRREHHLSKSIYFVIELMRPIAMERTVTISKIQSLSEDIIPLEGFLIFLWMERNEKDSAILDN